MSNQSISPHDANQGRHRAKLLRASALLPLVCLLSACGGGPEPIAVAARSESDATVRSASASAAQATTSSRSFAPMSAVANAVPSPQRGVLLSGLPGENAYAAVHLYLAGDRQVPAANPPGPAQTRPWPQPLQLSATLHLAATVGQVNSALNAVGGRIVAMKPGRKTLTVELTHVGTGSPSNQEAAATLIASRAFQWVQGPGLPVLPDALTADPAVSEPSDDHAPRF